jgi:hypothetical protein
LEYYVVGDLQMKIVEEITLTKEEALALVPSLSTAVLLRAVGTSPFGWVSVWNEDKTEFTGYNLRAEDGYGAFGIAVAEELAKRLSR